MTVTAAIDPGITGAIAIFDSLDLADIIDMPVTRHPGWNHQIVNADHIAELLLECCADRVVIETPQPRPGNGMRTVAASLASWGVLLGAAHHIPVTLVAPQTWTKALNVGADKTTHRAKASDLYGSDRFTRRRDDGRADAVLVGHWWLHHFPLMRTTQQPERNTP